MKIAFIGDKIIPSATQSIQKYVEEVSLCMAEKGHDVFIYSFDEKLAKKFKGLQNIKIKLIPNILKMFPAWMEILWASLDSASEKYDVVHYQAKNTFFLSKIVKICCKGTKIVSSFDLVCDFKTRPGMNFKEEKDVNVLGKWNLRKKRYMLLAGDFNKQSGAHFLIEAFKQLENHAKTPNNFKLVILQMGERDEDYVKYLKTIANGRDNIIILEKQIERINWQIFLGAHIFVQASYGEENSLGELTRAMLSGVAPLVSNTKQNMEMISDSGYVFEAKSLTDLADKLAYLLSRAEEVEKAGLKAKAKMEKEFGWEKIAQKTIEVCKN